MAPWDCTYKKQATPWWSSTKRGYWETNCNKMDEVLSPDQQKMLRHVVLGHISKGVFSMVLPTGGRKRPAGLALFGSPPSLFPAVAGDLSWLIVTHTCCKWLGSEHPLPGLLHRWIQASL